MQPGPQPMQPSAQQNDGHTAARYGSNHNVPMCALMLLGGTGDATAVAQQLMMHMAALLAAAASTACSVHAALPPSLRPARPSRSYTAGTPPSLPACQPRPLASHRFPSGVLPQTGPSPPKPAPSKPTQTGCTLTQQFHPLPPGQQRLPR